MDQMVDNGCVRSLGSSKDLITVTADVTGRIQPLTGVSNPFNPLITSIKG